MSYSEGTHPRDLTESYPRCFDSEARMCCYPFGNTIGIPPLYVIAGSSGRMYLKESDLILSSAACKAIREVLECALPVWVTQKSDVPALNVPSTSQKCLGRLVTGYRSASRRDKSMTESGYYIPWNKIPQWQSKVFELTLHRAISLSLHVNGYCKTDPLGSSMLVPSLGWTPSYDTIFEYVFHDILLDAGLTIDFRPRWSAFPSEHNGEEWPVIIPDVVLSVRIPDSPIQRSAWTHRAHHHHPAFPYRTAEGQDMEVPLLLVEYVRSHTEAGEVGREAHENHLCAAMCAALILYEGLQLDLPIFGLLFHSEDVVDMYVGVLEPGDRNPNIHGIRVSGLPGGFEAAKPFPMFHLYTVLVNLQGHAQKVTTRILPLLDVKMELSALNRFWPASQPLNQNRRVIDRKHPPLFGDSHVLRFLFGHSRPDIKDWLQRGGVDIQGTPLPITALPDHVREWLEFFQPETYDSPMLLAVMEDCKKGMTTRTQDVLDEFCREHNKTLNESPSPHAAGHISSVLALSMTFCSHAQDLGNGPACHTLTNHWIALYRSFFSGLSMWDVITRYNHQWAVHARLCSDVGLPATFSEDEIQPDVAFCLSLRSMLYRRPHDDQETVSAFAEEKGPDLNVAINQEASGIAPNVNMPLCVVEFILTPNNDDERRRHLAHLSVAMRSALAVWQVHCVDAPVIGILVDRNMVNFVVGWIDERTKVCVIQEIADPQFSLDMLKPYDAVKLCTLLVSYSSQRFEAHVNAVIDSHVCDAITVMSQANYQSWKEYEAPTEMLNQLNISAWQSGVSVQGYNASALCIMCGMKPQLDRNYFCGDECKERALSKDF